jgi:hypothetical protein
MRLKILTLSAILLTGAVVFWGCEWSGGNSDFNTSKGAGANVNISGVYRGTLAGGKAVSSTSNGNITSFTLTQAGNRVDVTDNQGSRYSGSVGTPILSSLPSGTSVVPPGWLAAQFQVGWSGQDGVAAVPIQFSGVIDVVTIENVQGTSSSASSSSSADIEFEGGQGTNNSQTIIIEEPAGDGTTNRIIIVNNDPNAVQITTNASQNIENSTESSTSFSLSEANSQLRLRGTWVEEGGRSSSVSCISPGNAGTITVDE